MKYIFKCKTSLNYQYWRNIELSLFVLRRFGNGGFGPGPSTAENGVQREESHRGETGNIR